MSNFKFVLLTATFMLAMAFTFSCSDDSSDGGGLVAFCVSDTEGKCYAQASSLSQCREQYGSSFLYDSSCPVGYQTAANAGSSSSSGGSNGDGNSSESNTATQTAVSNTTFDIWGITAIAWGGDKFVAGGAAGKMAYSVNGTNWTAITPTDNGISIFGNNQILSIAWGKNKFIAGGAYGEMAYSTDGINWTEVSSFPITSSDIAWGEDKFVAVGKGGIMAYSADGTSWTKIGYGSGNGQSAFDHNEYIEAVAWGGGMFVAGGFKDGYPSTAKMAYSTNGTNWTAVSNTTFGDSPIWAIAYGNGMFVAVGQSGKMAYSTNGTSWTAVSNSTFGDGDRSSIESIAYGNGKFIAGGIGKMAESTDGINWTAITSALGNNTIYGIAWDGNRFVAVGSSGKIAYSNQ